MKSVRKCLQTSEISFNVYIVGTSFGMTTHHNTEFFIIFLFMRKLSDKASFREKFLLMHVLSVRSEKY